MNRTEFVKQFTVANNQLDKRRIKTVIYKWLEDCRNVVSKRPDQINLVIAMEEMAELQKEVSKYIRGKNNKIELTEEIADVLVCIVSLLRICDIPTSDVYRAMNVKFDRIEGYHEQQNKDASGETGREEKDTNV